LNGPKKSILTAGNTDLEINNKRKDCKIGTVLVGVGRVNEGD
jgi:hypothetical protein